MNIEAWELANTVSGYGTTFAGVMTVMLTLLIAPQPRRWMLFYISIIITGIATVWFHGFGETFIPRVADISSNLLVVWVLQLAILGDFYTGAIRTYLPLTTGLWCLTVPIVYLIAGPETKVFLIRFGNAGGFTYGEVTLILNSLLATILLSRKRKSLTKRDRRLLMFIVIIFLFGLGLATASNSKVDMRILAYHATWHLVASYGFMALWAFNVARFNLRPARSKHELGKQDVRDAESRT